MSDGTRRRNRLRRQKRRREAGKMDWEPISAEEATNDVSASSSFSHINGKSNGSHNSRSRSSTRNQSDDEDMAEAGDVEDSSAQASGSGSANVRPAVVISPEDKARAAQSKERGNDAFKAKRHDEAIRLYTEAIDADPSEPSYYTNRAAAQMSLHRYREALEDCNRAASMQGSSPNAKTLTRLARCHFQLGDLTSARSTLERAQRAAPTDVAVKTLSSQVERTDAHIKAFSKYRDEKQYQLASIALDKASAEVASLPLSWRLMRADLMMRRGQLDSANSVVSDALRLNPSDPETLVTRAKVLLAQGSDLNKAVQHAQAALRADPEHRVAIRLLRKCRKLEAAKDSANAAFKAGKTDEAIDLYTQALDLAAQGSDEDGDARGFRAILFSNRATAQAKNGKHDAAIKDCSESLELNPGNVKALRIRARSYLAVERYQDAVNDFDKAVKEMPGTAEAEALKRELRNAEIDLKRSKKKDYYKILGVGKTATGAEIKKAYRKESLLHHPDKGGDEEKFKLCNEAFGVLSDDTKRRRYDAGADDAESDMASGGGFGPFGGGGAEVNLADLFGAGGMGGMGGGMGGMGGSPFGGGPFGGGGARRGRPSQFQGFQFQ